MFLFWPGFGHTRTHESISIRPSCLGVWLGSSSHGRQIRSLAFCILAGLGLPWLHTHMPRFCSHTRIPFSLSFGAWCTCQWCHTHTCGCQRTRTVTLLLGFGSSFYSDSSALCVAKIRIWNKKRIWKGKSLFCLLNFGPNLLFFPRPQNRLFRLFELPKPFVRPPLSGFRVTWQQFSLFLLYLFWLNLWKIILNHKKIIK